MKGNVMTKEINIALLLKVLKSAWWKMLIITVAVAIAVAAFTSFFVPKQYAASTVFYVLNTSTTSEYTTQALLSAAEYLSNDYIQIIKGDVMINTILERCRNSEELKALGYTADSFKSANAIRSMISSSTSKESSTFSITVTYTDPQLAHYICKFIEEEAPSIIKETSRPSYKSSMYVYIGDTNGNGIRDEAEFQPISEEDLECVKTLRTPSTATLVSPNIVSSTLIAAMLAAVLSYAIFLIVKISDNVIRTADNAEEMVNQTVIGDIPTWSTENKNVKENKDENK